MTAPTHCPMCGRTFEADSGAWLRLECPACGTVIADGPDGLALVDSQAARRMARPPAIGLMIVGVLIVLAGQALPAAAGYTILSAPAPAGDEEETGLILVLGAVAVFGLAGLLLGGTIVAGGYRMYHLRSYPLAVTASLLAINSVFATCLLACCPFALFALAGIPALPVGIWALVVLNDLNVKRAFR